MNLAQLTEFGWRIEDNELFIDWDSEENMVAMRERLTKRCHCKTGCKTARCSCKKRGKTCTEGCECVDCSNIPYEGQDNNNNLYEVSIEEEDEELLHEVEETMHMAFGERYFSEQESDNDDTQMRHFHTYFV